MNSGPPKSNVNSRRRTAAGRKWRRLLAAGYASHGWSAGGFSLLEVILALAILAGAMAVLGEIARNGMNNAHIARDITVAQLLCESKMAEIAAGITLPEAVLDVPFDTTDDPAEPDWLYSIEVEPIGDEGLLAVRVTVVKDLASEKYPAEFSLTRWIVDPSLQGSTDTATAEQPNPT